VQALVGDRTWHAAAPWDPPLTHPRRPPCRRDRTSGGRALTGHAPCASVLGAAGQGLGGLAPRRGPPSTPHEGSPCLLQPWALPHRATVPPPRGDAPARHHRPGGARPPPRPGARRRGHARREESALRPGGTGTPYECRAAAVWRHGRAPAGEDGGRAPRCRRPGRVAAPPSSCPCGGETPTSPQGARTRWRSTVRRRVVLPIVERRPHRGGRVSWPGKGPHWCCLPHPWCPTPGFSCRWKRERRRSVRWKRSAANPCSAGLSASVVAGPSALVPTSGLSTGALTTAVTTGRPAQHPSGAAGQHV
jgi:hypothetical protein